MKISTHLSKLRGFSAPRGTPVCRKTWGEPLSPVVFPSGRLHSSHKPQRRPLESRPVGKAIEDDVTDLYIWDIVTAIVTECKYARSLAFALMNKVLSTVV